MEIRRRCKNCGKPFTKDEANMYTCPKSDTGGGHQLHDTKIRKYFSQDHPSIQFVDCPHCNARIGEPCHVAGSVRCCQTHKARVDAFEGY